MFYQDLTKCNYFGTSKSLIGVGWLERDHEFAREQVPTNVYRKLMELLVRPFQPVFKMGWHKCNLCKDAADEPMTVEYQELKITAGVANLFVPGEDSVFVAPSLIAHYIQDHQYCPPLVFQTAVLDCPEMNTAEYFQRLAKKGLEVNVDHVRSLYGLDLHLEKH